MLIRIDQSAPDPLYRQIRDQIVAALASGELAPGNTLPSVRSLASDLGINLHTVNKAYALLRDEGYVVMRGRSGAVIADTQRAASSERLFAAEHSLARDLRKLAIEYKSRGGSEQHFTKLAESAAREVFSSTVDSSARSRI